MKKMLEWFNGKKLIISGIYWAIILPSLAIIYDNQVPENIEKTTQIIGLILTYIGLGHRIVKHYKVK